MRATRLARPEGASSEGDRGAPSGEGDRGEGGERPPRSFDRGPARSFDRGPARGPRNFGGPPRGPRNFDRGPARNDQGSSGGGGAPRNFNRDNRGPGNFNRDNRGPGNFNRDDRGAPRNFDRGPARSFNRDDRGPGNFNRDDRGPARSFNRDDRGPRPSGDRRDRRNDSPDARPARQNLRPAPPRDDRRDDRNRGRGPARDVRAPAGQRRAFSMPRAPGRIDTGGEREFADRLGFALHVAGSDDIIVDSLTHPFHSYPARTHPATARELVALVSESMPPRGLLVDPFCGSGTSLVEARAAGLRAIGVDVNPLAVLVARAKTWTAPAKVRAQLKNVGHAIAGEVLAAGKQARRATAEPTPLRGPKGFDPNARNTRLAAWFAPHVRRELEAIAHALDEVSRQDAEMAQVLTAALSAILYKVSSRTSDTNATWVQRNVARGSSVRWFQQRVDLLCAGLDDLAKAPGSPPEIFEADMRALGDLIPAGGAHGIVTSPPYAGTYDYADHQRLRFDFLGLRHRHLDQQEIGARRSLVGDSAGPRWRSELGDAIESIGTLLAPGALATLVIGDSIAAGRAFFALDDVRAALTGDLELVAWASQERAMLGAVERNAFGDRGKNEHLVLLRKTR